MKNLTKIIIVAVVIVLIIIGGGYFYYIHSQNDRNSYGGGYLSGITEKPSFLQEKIELNQSFADGLNDGKNQKKMLYENTFKDVFAKQNRILDSKTEAKETLSPDEEKILSYSVGHMVGTQYSERIGSVSFVKNKDQFFAGYLDAIEGKKSKLDDKALDKVKTYFQEENLKEQKKQEEKYKEQTAKLDETNKKNLEKGEKFLAENKKKEGVKTTETGLQYKVLREGQGKQAISTSVVTVNYKGTLIDGTEFDSSYTRGTPATFPLNQVILGWQEAIPLMKEGGKYQIFIPPSLGYGKSETPKIPPGSVLIFEIELLKVK